MRRKYSSSLPCECYSREISMLCFPIRILCKKRLKVRFHILYFTLIVLPELWRKRVFYSPFIIYNHNYATIYHFMTRTVLHAKRMKKSARNQAGYVHAIKIKEYSSYQFRFKINRNKTDESCLELLFTLLLFRRWFRDYWCWSAIWLSDLFEPYDRISVVHWPVYYT